MITEGYWVLEDGRILSLFTPNEIRDLPPGTVLHTIKGVEVVVGRDVIDYTVHLGYGQFVDNTADEGKPRSHRMGIGVDDTPATTDEVITIKRIARSLNLNVATIARMAARGDFPRPLPIKVNKKLFLRSAVEAWWHTVLGGQNGSPFPLAPADPGLDE